WYQHDVQKWPEFKKRYFAEIEMKVETINELVSYISKGNVVLLFGYKELQHNKAVALEEYINMINTRQHDAFHKSFNLLNF
ncbi:MAG: DUF488 family protein, partial [Nitrospirae bacterium]|nr:DUF488 family protein [Nitrospirota bacterium]